MSILASQWQAVKTRIHQAEISALRPEDSVRLLAASKSQPPQKLRELYSLGQRVFGENYVQEAIPKIMALSDLDIEWHFIGPIQRNKTSLIAHHFKWVHGLDRLNIAERLNAACNASRLNVLIQVNIDNEPGKQGISPHDAIDFATEISKLPNLNLRGLMTIPRPVENGNNPNFNELRTVFQKLVNKGFKFDTLSMGMSNDFEAAIMSGSTCVRLGTALFGPRS
ncbi:MAG TPA: YggS family pyridoxal phosphate-dependent enzyme [Burkholderiales bacterium]|nr:YggS family pyridoxal phosphate-dependent enzyme [Burkholderiales bacterium]